MTTHHFQPTHYYRTLGSHEPVLRVADGDTVTTTCVDAFGNDARNQLITPRGNPMTGPFFVEGAEPGDVLAVHLDRLTPNREIGYTRSSLSPNVVDPEYAQLLPDRTEKIAEWHIDGEKGTATLIRPETKLGKLTIPLSPMLGCFGVAPADEQAISTATSGPYGGNMDYRGFVQGVTVYFPVFAPGALFFLGDGHAVQGDGEIVGTGIEISFDAQFTVRLIKNKKMNWPHGENAEYVFTVGNARPLDQALQHATTEMMHLLEDDYGLDMRSAGLFLGQCVQYDLGNVFDPAYTMVCKVAKRLLKGL